MPLCSRVENVSRLSYFATPSRRAARTCASPANRITDSRHPLGAMSLRDLIALAGGDTVLSVMASLTIPITVDQIRELARQLSAEERRALLDMLLAERFEAVLSDADRGRAGQPAVSDEQVQAEVDAVRRQRREDRQRAAGG